MVQYDLFKEYSENTLRNKDERTMPEFHNCHFKSIQALRGLAALFIVLEHVRYLNCGAFGVDIFFCISGFMIIFSTEKSAEHFFAKRLIRILPLYYLFTLATFAALLFFPNAFETTEARPEFLIKSLLFLPFDIGGGVLQPLMRIGWTVNCEIFFYLIFWIGMKINHKFRALFSALFLGVFVALAAVFPEASAFLSFYGNPVMLDFCFGMVLYYIAKRLYMAKSQAKLPNSCKWISVTGVIILFAYFLITRSFLDILAFRRPLFWGLPAALLVLCFFLAELYFPMPTTLVRLGDISFSLYLVHYYPVAFLDRKVFDFSAFSSQALLGTALAIAISVILSFISFQIIEQGFCGYLKRKLLR